jgi:hypothetical protein
MKTCMRLFLCCLCALSISRTVGASGHGPVFGGATPTLGKGGWSFDQAWMGSHARNGEDDQMLRSMIGYGLTKDLQITVSLPIGLSSGTHAPMGRMTAMMSSSREAEALVGWRFQRKDVGTGGRFESTVYAGAAVPTESSRGGFRTAPSAYLSVASGYASRAHYFWTAASYQRRAENDGDRLGSVKSLSVVYGYRPSGLRVDYPKPDLRFFVEAVGESIGAPRRGGVRVTRAARTVFAGPTTLLLYKQYGVSGGVLFPVYQRSIGNEAEERVRFTVNFSYFFWIK